MKILVLSNNIAKAVSEKIALLRETSLKGRCARSGMILATAIGAERFLRLIRNMILARLLAPETFGLMAIVLTAATLLEALSDVGVRQSIIHSKNGFNPRYLNMAWWFQTVRGFVLYAIAFAAANPISSFYGNKELTILLRVAFIAVIFRGLMSPSTHTLEKELRYGRWILIMQGGAVLNTIVTIALTFWIRNVWALVIGGVVEAISCCFISFALCPFCPRFSIDRDSLLEILNYARGMFGLTLLTIIALKTDIIVLAKVVSSERLGIYALVFGLAQQPATVFGETVGRILLSAFAEKQDLKKLLHFYILRVIKYTFILGIPLMTIAAVFSGTILSLVYGAEYVSAASAFGILCFSMLFSIQTLVLSKVYLGLGKPGLHRRVLFLQAVLMMALMYPGVILFGLSGAAIVILVANIFAVCLQFIWLRNIVDLRLRDYILCLVPVSWSPSHGESNKATIQ